MHVSYKTEEREGAAAPFLHQKSWVATVHDKDEFVEQGSVHKWKQATAVVLTTVFWLESLYVEPSSSQTNCAQKGSDTYFALGL